MFRVSSLLECPKVEQAVAAPDSRRRSRTRQGALEQLSLDLGPARPRWSFSRLVVRSRHQARIRSRLGFVRHFYPELDGVTLRIGLVRKAGVLGWGSLDPDRPGVWVRPRQLAYFTIAHEFTHLLQARGLVPRGERACDLWALTRSPLLIDCAPGYLRMPRALHGRRRLGPREAKLLHETARRAVEARERGDRRYLSRFEREIAQMFGPDAGTG